MNLKHITRRAAIGLALVGAVVACGDLTVEPKSRVSSGNIFTDPASYRAFIAKIYAGLSVTGQRGPDGDGDIFGIDEGFSQYLRTYWQLQQLPTDETIIGWGDTGLPELNQQTWSETNPFVLGMYSRIFYQVALVNQFLRETTPDKLDTRGNVSGELRTQIAGYRQEARFMRALSYWHALDLFGNVPIVDENFNVGQLPRQTSKAEVLAFIESELNAVKPSLPARSTGDYYGRASQSAVDMILAKLYLNAEVYTRPRGGEPGTGTARWSDARAAAERVIATPGLALDGNYMRLFSLDNTTSPEIIFQIPFDGTRTQTWGGMTFLTHAAVGGSMTPATYGIGGAWWGLRAKPEAVDRYTAGDRRDDYFYTTGQSKEITRLDQFVEGFAAPKYRNISTTGQVGSNTQFPDTDFPMFRLADAYLIYAEAVLRGGGGTRAQALTYVNEVRRRAFGDNSGDITDAQLTLDFILAERGRELFWEGHRRPDLIRYDLFSQNGVWTFKGGIPAGRVTDRKFDLYPFPGNERSANPTIQQNPGY